MDAPPCASAYRATAHSVDVSMAYMMKGDPDPVSVAGTRSDALGFTTIAGLPAHVLLVHFAVVLVPLAAFCLVASLKPAIAHRFGVWLPVLSIGALVSVFAAMNAGGWLQDRVPDTALVRHHVAIAGQLWPFSAAVALFSVAVWYLRRRSNTSSAPPRAAVTPWKGVYLLVAVLALVAATGSIVEVYRIGEAGSRAAWTGHFSQTTR